MAGYDSVKQGLVGLTSAALVEKGRNCLTMLITASGFTFPPTFLASIAAACTALEEANEAVLFNGGLVNHKAKRLALKELEDLLRQLAAFVQAQSAGDGAKILSAGFEVRRRGTPVDQLGTPLNVRPVLTNFSGEIRLRWNPLQDAVNFGVYINSVDPLMEDKWELVGYTSRTAFTAEALESAKYYWFRVQGLGRKGLMSPMSQVVKALAA